MIIWALRTRPSERTNNTSISLLIGEEDVDTLNAVKLDLMF